MAKNEKKPCFLARVFLVLYFSVVQLKLLDLAGSAGVDAAFSISSRLATTVCEQRRKYFQSRVIQSPAVYPPSSSINVGCGSFDIETFGGSVTYKGCSSRSERLKSFYGYSRGASPRIVGGVEATPHEFPSTVIILTKPIILTYIERCAGVILSPEWVLTAAHCIRLIEEVPIYYVRAGVHIHEDISAKTPRRDPIKHFKHPEYEDKYDHFVNDIALLKMDKPFEYTDWVQPAKLVDEGYEASGEFTAIGWGQDCNPHTNVSCSLPLKKVNVPFISDDLCVERLQPKYKVLPETVICAGYDEGVKDTCKADGGGPLFQMIDGVRTVVGITSWGAAWRDECGMPKKPSVYTDVAYYRKWIRETMAAN